MIRHDCLSEAEIFDKWRRAEDKDMMLTILADLTDSTEKEMAKYLDYHKEGKKPKQDHSHLLANDNRMALYKDGLDDAHIARKLGVATSTIWNWRRRHNLPRCSPKAALPV